MEIFKPVAGFDFKKITLASPQPLQGSSYFTKINYGENNLPLYIQLPKCLTKQSIMTTTKRGKYSDLMYERGSQDEFIEWIESLESACQDKIDEKKQLWFQNEFTRDDIETMMVPVARMYKSGKYVLIRAYINENKHTGKDNCIVYNENEVNVDITSITEETYIIPLILIEGIRFTSRSFEIDIKIIQMMVLNKAMPEMMSCLIKKTGGTATVPVPPALVPEPMPTALVSAPASLVPVPTPVPTALALAPVPASPVPASEKEDREEKDLENTTKPLLLPEMPLEKNDIEEIQINYETVSDTIILKKPIEVYYEQYKIAKQKALELRENALHAILEAKTSILDAKNIKSKYNLEEDEDSEEIDDTF